MFQKIERVFKRFKKNINVILGGFYGINITIYTFTSIYNN